MATKHPQLKVEKRSVLGKKNKKLRKEGFIPANIYGKGLESVSVQVPFKDFQTTYKEVGETGLLELLLDSETRPVLIHNVQIDFQTQTPIHADFYQVNLKEKVKTMVPLVVVGEPKAVTEKIGLLLQPISEVEVEALPADLPESIEIPVEHLAAIDEQITLAELKIPNGVTVLTDREQVVAKISELVSKEAAEQAAADAAASDAAKAETAGAEAPAEGAEAGTEEKKTEEKSEQAAAEEKKE